MEGEIEEWAEGSEIRVYHYVPQLIAHTISGAFTGLFVLAGAITGAVSGALAGRASDSGIIRGAGLGAVAGAVLSVEVLEASRAYWYSELCGSRISSPMADLFEELLHGRFVGEQVPPTMLMSYRWQLRISNVSYDEIYDVYDGAVAVPRGLSWESLKRLPCHVVSYKQKEASDACCTICLQDIEVGEVARSLPQCLHTFHLACVDKWLMKHGSCPICRQAIKS